MTTVGLSIIGAKYIDYCNAFLTYDLIPFSYLFKLRSDLAEHTSMLLINTLHAVVLGPAMGKLGLTEAQDEIRYNWFT
jgi:hypothetical protein